MPDFSGWLAFLVPFLLKLFVRRRPRRERGFLRLKADGFDLEWRWDRDNRPDH
jgi:hypothetical protein